MNRKRSRGLLALAFAAVVMTSWSSPTRPLLDAPWSWSDTDFQILWAAGTALDEGADPHDPAVLDAVGRRAGRSVTPFCAAQPLVLRAFGLASDDFGRAYSTWRNVNIGLWLLSVCLLAAVVARVLQARGVTEPAVRRCAAFGTALVALGVGEPVWLALWFNSTNLLATTAILAALLAAVTRRERLEGVALAVAVVAKTSPALLIVVAALAGRWRTVFSALTALVVMTGVSLAWAGRAVHESWWRAILPRLGYAPRGDSGAFENSLHTWNLAPNGWLSRSAYGAGWSEVAPWMAMTISAAVLVWMVLRVRAAGPVRDHAAGLLALYGLGTAGSFLISSVTWPHHLVLGAPAVAAVIGGCLWNGRTVWAAVGLMSTALLWLPMEQGPNTLPPAARTLALFALFAATAAALADAHSPRTREVPEQPTGSRS